MKNQFKLEINTRYSELEAIFDGNHQNYIKDKSAIRKRNFDKLVCVCNGEAVGYLVLYHKPDFVKREGFSAKLDYTPVENCVYIWHICTRKDFQGKGAAGFLIEQIKKVFSDKVIYSITDMQNVATTRIHEKAGFIALKTFEAVKWGKEAVYRLWYARSLRCPCLDCNKETLYYDLDSNRPASADWDWYMVKDAIWKKYVPEQPPGYVRDYFNPNDKGYYLCFECLQKRVGRKLAKDDFPYHEAWGKGGFCIKEKNYGTKN